MKDKNAVTVKPKKKKFVLPVILLAVAVAAVLIARSVYKKPDQAATETTAVEIQPVQKRDLSDTISLKGTIAGASRTNVTSRAVSEITALNVQLGDIVKEGDLLCTLDPASIREKISAIEKNISNTRTAKSISSRQASEAVRRAKEDQERELAVAQQEITYAEEACAGTQMMFDKEEVDFQTLVAAQRAVGTAKQNYNNILISTNRAISDAQLALQQESYSESDTVSKDELNDLRKQLTDCEVKAPCGGVVTAVNVSVGDVNAEKVTILTIEDTSELKLVTTVSEADILKLREGMKAVVTADATGEEEISGKVSRVVRVKNQGTGDQQGASGGGYSVEVSIGSSSLLVGMEARVKIMIKEKGRVLAVPYDLVMYDENGGAYVLVAEPKEDGSAVVVRKNIEPGEEVDYYMEVTGGDLKEGDQMIYDYTRTITEGQTLTAEQMTISGNAEDAGGADGGSDETSGSMGAEAE